MGTDLICCVVTLSTHTHCCSQHINNQQHVQHTLLFTADGGDISLGDLELLGDNGGGVKGRVNSSDPLALNKFL